MDFDFVRGMGQPPTFPCLTAAPAGHGRFPFLNDPRLPAFLLAAALAVAGCKAAVNLSGSFATPRETVSGDVQATTNGVTLGGSYQTGNTNVAGTITVVK